MSIAGRFSLLMTLSLLVVMTAAGFFLLDKSRAALRQANIDYTDEAARLMSIEELAHAPRDVLQAVEDGNKTIERALQELRQPLTYQQKGDSAHVRGRITRFPVVFAEGGDEPRDGILIQYDERGNLLAPADLTGGQADSLFGLILLATAMVLLVGAGVAFKVAMGVTKPIEQLVDDVRTISRGNLQHRTRVKGGGEVYHLARQIDRMAQSLEEAQDAEVELGVREREREVAREVREALLPETCPEVPGYEIGDLHVDAAEPGGDFHDFIEVGGRVILLVCEVSGKGVPGALVGATARAYLRNELARGEDLLTTLKKINREIARDVRRGMYVTAMCVSLDPQAGVAEVICAGHKLPLIRFDAEGGQVRLIQPEGIALGFDKGPVFDHRVELARVPVEPGDRLVLANTGPVQVVDTEGNEFGEKAFYRVVARNAKRSPESMLNGILTALETHAGDAEFPVDISLAILARDA